MELWILKHHFLYDHLLTHEDFISFIEWLIKRPFYPKDQRNEASGSGRGNGKEEDEEDDYEDEEESKKDEAG